MEELRGFESKKVIEGETRNTRMGGFSDSYLFLLGVGELKPRSVETSKTGRHGKKIWIIDAEDEKKAMLVIFRISNTGKRSAIVKNAPIPEIEQYIKYNWAIMQTNLNHIVKKLDEVFRNLKMPEELRR